MLFWRYRPTPSWDPDQQVQTRDRWLAWWDKHKDRVEIDLDEMQRPAGPY